MALRINSVLISSARALEHFQPATSVVPRSRSGQRGHVRAKESSTPLSEQGRLSVANVMHLLDISHSALYAGIPRRFPSPDFYEGNKPYWDTQTIREFKEREDATHAEYERTFGKPWPRNKKRTRPVPVAQSCMTNITNAQ